MPETVEEINDLLGLILEVTGDKASTGFWIKAIRELGLDRVRMELSEVRAAVREGKAVRNPAAMLTALLTAAMKDTPVDAPTDGEEKQYTPLHAQDGATLLDELVSTPVPDKAKSAQRTMPEPYSKKVFQMATIITADFFTLSTNKAKSDEVVARFRVGDGQICDVPMIRGRVKPGAEERGILTAEHGRVLSAVEHFWAEGGAKYSAMENGALICTCQVFVRDLAKKLGWKDFSGQALTHLVDRVVDLATRPYYLYREPKGVSFTFLDSARLREIKIGKVPSTWIDVNFSDAYSRQLLMRRAVSRPLDMLTMRSEIGFLLRLYLEPILWKRETPHNIGLEKLIKILNLPKAAWHDRKGQRKQKLGDAVAELNGQRTVDGRRFEISIEQGLDRDDYMLVARLRTENVEESDGKQN